LHRLEAVFDRRCQEFVERRSKTASKRLEKLIFNCAQASNKLSLNLSYLKRWMFHCRDAVITPISAEIFSPSLAALGENLRISAVKHYNLQLTLH
jgi:hypothetical protein